MQDFVPRPWQPPMINHIMDKKRCAVWAGMGLGKSSAVLDALENINLVEDVYPALVTAPLRVARSTWPNEVTKWKQFSHLRISAITGTLQERLVALHREADIYTVNFENLPWLIDQIKVWPFKTCVVDEATKLSGFRLRQGKIRAFSIAKYAHLMHRFIELTGTPGARGLHALWGQLWYLDQGRRLGRSFSAFEQRWFYTDRSGYGLKMFKHSQTEIHEAIKDICLSVNAADYFDVKKPIMMPVYVDLDPMDMKLYKQMERKAFVEIKGHAIEAFNAAAKMNKCLQLANGAAYIDSTVGNDEHPKAKAWTTVHNVKIEALESIIEEANGTPVLVGYNFRSDLARLKKAFPQGRHIETKRDEDDFIAGKIPVAFAHPASLGHGVDGFQYATNIVAFFGLTWSLEDFEQFIERVGPVRQMQAGFNRNVFVYLIIARGTVDEDVVLRQESKRDVHELLLEAMNRRKTND